MATKVFIFGLDNAGKTALNTLMRVGKPPDATRPTLAFDISSMVLNDIKYTVFDAPGQRTLRKTWNQGFHGAKILLFVLDVSKKERFGEAKKELDNVINNSDTRGAPLIVCFHKMDLDISKENLAEAKGAIGLSYISERDVFPFETSIYSPNVVKAMKDKIVDITIENRWNA